jgi:hypothetical protein
LTQLHPDCTVEKIPFLSNRSFKGLKMKIYKNVLLIVTSMILISGCATGNIQMPQKYALEDQLERVDWIYKQRIRDWEKVDNQSLIIEISPGAYYLMVLKMPARELLFQNRISLSSTGSRIRAGLDDLILYNAHMRVRYPIEKIFKIRGRTQMHSVRDQLTGIISDKQKDSGTDKPVKSRLPDKNSRAI